MSKSVKKEINKWIENNGPFGLEKLVIKSEVARRLIERARVTGELPTSKHIANKLLCALNMDPKSKDEAS